jgi:hypothetical protein
MGALGSINGRYVGHCLSIGDIDGLAPGQASIILRQYRSYLFVGNFGEFDVTGGANKIAGTTGYTCF